MLGSKALVQRPQQGGQTDRHCGSCPGVQHRQDYEGQSLKHFDKVNSWSE